MRWRFPAKSPCCSKMRACGSWRSCGRADAPTSSLENAGVTPAFSTSFHRDSMEPDATACTTPDPIYCACSRAHPAGGQWRPPDLNGGQPVTPTRRQERDGGATDGGTGSRTSFAAPLAHERPSHARMTEPSEQSVSEYRKTTRLRSRLIIRELRRGRRVRRFPLRAWEADAARHRVGDAGRGRPALSAGGYRAGVEGQDPRDAVSMARPRERWRIGLAFARVAP
jgi:hypothetical protein